MEPLPRAKMTVTRFILHILIGSYLCWVGSGGLTPDGAGYGIFGNLVGLAFILLGVLGIISGFVDAYKQSTGEWKSYYE